MAAWFEAAECTPPRLRRLELDIAAVRKPCTPPSPSSTCSTELPFSPRELEVDIGEALPWTNGTVIDLLHADEDGVTTVEVAGCMSAHVPESIAESVFEWAVFAAAGLSSICCSGGDDALAAGFCVDSPTAAPWRRRHTAEHVLQLAASGALVPWPAAGPLGSALRVTVLVALCPVVLALVALASVVLAVGCVVSVAFCLRSATMPASVPATVVTGRVQRRSAVPSLAPALASAFPC